MDRNRVSKDLFLEHLTVGVLFNQKQDGRLGTNIAQVYKSCDW